MARVHRVPKSRKAHQCRKGHEIPAGEPYMHASPGYRRRHPLIACMAHPFRPSELTTSLAAEPMAAVEAFEDAIDALDPDDDDALDHLEAAVEELRSEVEQYRDTRQDALDQWEHGNAQLEEYVERADEAVSSVEGIVVDVRSPEDFDSRDEWFEHVEEQIEEARDAVAGMEF